MATLTLYFDSTCPLCRREMARLRKWDRAGRLAFVDMSMPGFDPAPLGVTLEAMDAQLHGLRAAHRSCDGERCKIYSGDHHGT